MESKVRETQKREGERNGERATGMRAPDGGQLWDAAS